MNNIYTDKNFTVSYDKVKQLFQIAHKDPISGQQEEIEFLNPNKNIQTIIFNPKVITFDEANEMFKDICDSYPQTSFIGLPDGMHLLTLKTEDLISIRDNLTKIINNVS